jgi:hypothetical protein
MAFLSEKPYPQQFYPIKQMNKIMIIFVINI